MSVTVSELSIERALFKSNAVGFDYGRGIRFKSKILSPGAYNNNRCLPSHPGNWATIISAMKMVANGFRSEFDVIASVATGGIAHGVALSRELRVPHFIIKKEEKIGHGLAGLIDGDVGLLPRSRVLIIEDMSSTFESTLKAIPKIEYYDSRVVSTLAISTWGFPEFYQNVGERDVHVLTTGQKLLGYAAQEKLITPDYEDVLSDWLLNPRDESWVDGDWKIPE